jgi:hypothetical protein
MLLAMLTGMVNIAVFAAFRFCCGYVLLSNAEFKPFSAPWELDVSHYGWQKRQDRGNDVATDGKVGGKNGKSGMGCHSIHATMRAVVIGRG